MGTGSYKIRKALLKWQSGHTQVPAATALDRDQKIGKAMAIAFMIMGSFTLLKSGQFEKYISKTASTTLIGIGLLNFKETLSSL